MQTALSRIELVTLRSKFCSNQLFWPHFSGSSRAVVKLLSSWTYVQEPSSCLSGAWRVPGQTLYFISIQTAASHGLDNSTALPVPALCPTFIFDVNRLKRNRYIFFSFLHGSRIPAPSFLQPFNRFSLLAKYIFFCYLQSSMQALCSWDY